MFTSLREAAECVKEVYHCTDPQTHYVYKSTPKDDGRSQEAFIWAYGEACYHWFPALILPVKRYTFYVKA